MTPPTRRNPALTDTMQEACIERMLKLGLNPNQCAELVEGKVSRSHVCDFLTRRSPMSSHKLQHLAAALGLRLKP